jgi:hypothetical protein
MDGIGEAMTTIAKDLKHLREVLTEAYPREELSLDALARVVAALTPLTDDQIDVLATDEDGLPNSHLEIARAVERAHGICDA